ncbi:hypothetical protein D3C81_1267360 [compost metagenome]
MAYGFIPILCAAIQVGIICTFIIEILTEDIELLYELGENQYFVASLHDHLKCFNYSFELAGITREFLIHHSGMIG